VRYNRIVRWAFASGIIGLGIFGLINGDFDGVWQLAPKALPWRAELAYVSAALMLACGLGLLWNRTESLAARVLFVHLALLVLLMKLPAVLKAPLVEGGYQSMAELVVVLAGAWVLVARSERTVRIAQIVFGLALIPLGLAHFIYLQLTAPLVPTWLPYHTAWAYFTGAAQIAAGCAVLVGILARLAATLEAAMLTAFTFLVWIPPIIATPRNHGLWSEITASWAISAAAWLVAASIVEARA
jgi:uncharacterized membrane protein